MRPSAAPLFLQQSLRGESATTKGLPASCRCWIADIIEAAKDVADDVLDAAEGMVQQVERDGNAALNAAKATLSAAQVGAQVVEGQSQVFPGICMAPEIGGRCTRMRLTHIAH